MLSEFFFSSPPLVSVQALRYQTRGWGVKAFDDLDDTGVGGVQNLAKPSDLILERSLRI